jgi:hypothetical protein
MFTYLHVLFRGTHWLRIWAQLQISEDAVDPLRKASRELETMAMQFFAYKDLRFSHKIAL